MSDRILSTAETRAKVGGAARNTLHNWVKTQGFPDPLILGPNKVGWRESEIDTWLAERPRGFLAPVARPAETSAAD